MPVFERQKSKLDQYYQLMDERLRLPQARTKLSEEYIGTDPNYEFEYHIEVLSRALKKQKRQHEARRQHLEERIYEAWQRREHAE
eukprot:7278835-Pyramimonas_sp.AAC.1